MKTIIKPILALLLLCAAASAAAAVKPDILYIPCDNLGYGDVKCLGGNRHPQTLPGCRRRDDLYRSAFEFGRLHAAPLAAPA
jgi:hypothetical protein